MTTKNFNANKMLMSAVAAVVFSFVFTTSANASTTPQEKQGTKLEIRVKTRPNGDSQKKQEQNKDQNKDQKQEQKQENKDIVSSMLQKFGVRVK